MVEQSFLSDPFIAARATPNMVGRSEVVAQIKAIVDAAVGKGILAHIIGAGGIGKTRLLGSLLGNFKMADDYLVAAELVDLYHAENNTVEGLVGEIYRVLNAAGVACPLYEAEIIKLQELQGNRPHATREITAAREKAVKSFVQDLKEQPRRVVIALDTAEKLDLQHNPIPERLGLSERRANTIAWIVDLVRQVDNVAVLLAGRPSVYGVADDLKSELPDRYEAVHLPGLREDEALAYFDAVLKALAESSDEDDLGTARRLEMIQQDKPDMRQTIFWVLRDVGEEPTIRPIWLALAIDYLSIATDPLIPEFLLPLEIARTLTAEGCERVRRRVGEVFVIILAKSQSPADELVRNLGWLRKGATRELLAKISGLSPDEFDLGWKRMRSLSFVKQRPRDDRFFLHDEMYDIIQRFMLAHVAEARKDRVFTDLNSYYEAAITKFGDDIDELVSPIVIDQPTPLISNLDEFNRLFHLRHIYYIEDIFYRLRQNALKGFDRYFYYSEEAVANSDEELGALLRAEMRAFVTESGIQNLAEGIDGLRYVDIVADEAVRWIGWLHSRGQNKEALALAHALDEDLLAEIITPAGPLAEAELNSWHGLMEAENANYKDAEDLITQAIAILNGFTAQKSRRWTGILARAYNNYGYLYNNLGRIHRSIDAYRQALPLWRRLKSTGELANTLNNLGFALGLIGDYDNAQVQIRDGLTWREKQGLRPAVGYSLSTLAEVSVHAFASEIAIDHAERALTIFEWTDHPRGRGVALRTLAEAKRRIGSSPLYHQPETSLRFIEEAEAAALEAVDIFRTQVVEPIRLLWALTELGRVYQEWFLWRIKFPEEQTSKERDGSLAVMSADELFNKSNAAFSEAAALAADRNLHGLQLDALINQYRLHNVRYGTEPGAESQTVRASIQEIFDRYYPNSDSAESRFYTKGILDIPRDEVLLRFGDWHTFLGNEAIDLYEQQGKQGNTALYKAAKHFFFAFRCYAVYSDFALRNRRTSRTLLYEAVKTFNPSKMRTLFECVERVEVEFGLSTSELKEFLIDQFGDQSQHFEFD